MVSLQGDSGICTPRPSRSVSVMCTLLATPSNEFTNESNSIRVPFTPKVSCLIYTFPNGGYEPLVGKTTGRWKLTLCADQPTTTRPQ
jgi:hypothetical protein